MEKLDSVFTYGRIAIGKALKFTSLVLALVVAVLTAYCGVLLPGLPNIEGLGADEYGRTTTDLRYKDIPENVVSAFVAAEDKNFFTHSGIDYLATLRAIKLFAQAREPVNGASTITMQLAKNVFLGPEKTVDRKLSEFMLARKIEKNFSKEEIMESYLNVIYFGNDTYGLEAAANKYFQKPLEELTLAETAILAGIPKAPGKFNPIASQKAALTRRNWVLQKMLVNKHIDQTQFEQAASTAI